MEFARFGNKVEEQERRNVYSGSFVNMSSQILLERRTVSSELIAIFKPCSVAF